MNASVRLAAALLGFVLVVGIACDDRPPETEAPPVPQALSDSIEAGYERLRRMYASADTLPPDVQRMRGVMGRMHGRMHHRQQGRGGGLREGRGRHEQGGMRGGQGMHGRHDIQEGRDRQRMHGRQHGRGMHGGARGGVRRDSARMWEWHQQMMGMHAQMARMHADSGLARRHRQMQRRHRQMMNAVPSDDEGTSPDTEDGAAASDAVPVAAGESLYGQHCASCHGPQGAGVGPFPPLAGVEWVTGEEDTTIRILLHGLQGRIEVNDRTYNNVMPAFGRRLGNDEIAALLSYIRSSWGNQAEAVSPEDVSEIRRQHVGRAQPWTVSQLRDEE
jgi:mono/diheme cytochrome c family protein